MQQTWFWESAQNSVRALGCMEKIMTNFNASNVHIKKQQKRQWKNATTNW